ncbi:hypothetical protein LOAG_03283 [Loa loa]|uniref:Uncharacterized protein n=1 Tax=Loa loa TaxID=7209 RepID=A0A1S0U5A3_LOALO|nr:hypothetical protein LOAG_03283 [Loa loa]EFO25203.1 hypothetical protein LOAG_03283 [Loa loa]
MKRRTAEYIQDDTRDSYGINFRLSRNRSLTMHEYYSHSCFAMHELFNNEFEAIQNVVTEKCIGCISKEERILCQSGHSSFHVATQADIAMIVHSNRVSMK